MSFQDFFVTLPIFLIIISVLVVAHEWGHFIVARIFGIRVDDFSIGFGPRMVRLGKRGDTEYNLRWLPIGGFVKIAGMEADEEPLIRAKDKILRKDNPSDPDSHEIPLIAENLPERDSHYTGEDGFNAKPIWQRSLVILAGPVMSFLFGYVVLCLMGCTVGMKDPTGASLNRVAEVEPGGVGYKIGLLSGDTITAINNVSITSGPQMVQIIRSSLNKQLNITVLRGSKTVHLTGTPQPDRDDHNHILLEIDVTSAGGLATIGLLPGDMVRAVDDADITTIDSANKALIARAGHKTDIIVMRDMKPTEVKGQIPLNIAQNLPSMTSHPYGILKFSPDFPTRHYGLITSLKLGNQLTGDYFQMLYRIVASGRLGQNAGSVIVMYESTSRAWHVGLDEVVGLGAQISISLAICNLLPIPILDGGHLLAFFLEWIRRGRKLSPREQEIYMQFGLAVIGTLFLLIVSNDILKNIRNQTPH